MKKDCRRRCRDVRQAAPTTSVRADLVEIGTPQASAMAQESVGRQGRVAAESDSLRSIAQMVDPILPILHQPLRRAVRGILFQQNCERAGWAVLRGLSKTKLRVNMR